MRSVQIHAQREQVGRRDPVSQGVMNLVDHRYAAIGQTLDEVHLPQRPAAVQRRAGDLADGVVEFPATTGGGQRPRPDVIAEVDLAVLPPHRVVELERDVDEFVAQRVQLIEPAVDDLPEFVDPERAPAHVQQFDDRDLERVHVHVRRLAVQQKRVPARQSLHDDGWITANHLPHTGNTTSGARSDDLFGLDRRPGSVNLVEEQSDCGGHRPVRAPSVMSKP